MSFLKKVTAVSQKINEPMWTLESAKATVKLLTPAFERAKMTVTIVGGVQKTGCSEHDLDLLAKIIEPIKHDTYYNIKELERGLRKIEGVESAATEEDLNYGSLTQVFLSNKKVIDIFYESKK